MKWILFFEPAKICKPHDAATRGVRLGCCFAGCSCFARRPACLQGGGVVMAAVISAAIAHVCDYLQQGSANDGLDLIVASSFLMEREVVS